MSETQADIDYRLDEQNLVRTLITTLHRTLDEDYVKVFGHLSVGLTAIISGVRSVNERFRMPYGMNRSNIFHVEVTNAWEEMLKRVEVFCTEDGKVPLNEDQFKWILKRLNEEMVVSIYAPIISARTRQNMWRV